MKDILIAVTRARIKSFSVRYEKEKLLPEIAVTLSLQTADGKEVTTYEAGTHHWSDSKKIDVSAGVYSVLPIIERELEERVVNNCKASLRLLPQNVLDMTKEVKDEEPF